MRPHLCTRGIVTATRERSVRLTREVARNTAARITRRADQDFFYIDQGTEFVYRVLFDAGISHEKGADHVGASLEPRILDSLAFIGRQLNPPRWIDDVTLKARAAQDAIKKARGYPVTPFDPNRIHAE